MRLTVRRPSMLGRESSGPRLAVASSRSYRTGGCWSFEAGKGRSVAGSRPLRPIFACLFLSTGNIVRTKLFRGLAGSRSVKASVWAEFWRGIVVVDACEDDTRWQVLANGSVAAR